MNQNDWLQEKAEIHSFVPTNQREAVLFYIQRHGEIDFLQAANELDDEFVPLSEAKATTELLEIIDRMKVTGYIMPTIRHDDD